MITLYFFFFFCRKVNSFNFNVVNWGDENKMCTEVKVDESEFNSTEILDDNAIEKIGKEVNELIDLLGNDDDDDENKETSNLSAVRYPGLTLKSTKRDRESNGN